MKIITKIEDKHIGRKAKCTICRMDVTDAEIWKESGEFYICQDIISGSRANDTRGYKYTWCVGGGLPKSLITNDVRNIRIVDTWDEEENEK